MVQQHIPHACFLFHSRNGTENYSIPTILVFPAFPVMFSPWITTNLSVFYKCIKILIYQFDIIQCMNCGIALPIYHDVCEVFGMKRKLRDVLLLPLYWNLKILDYGHLICAGCSAYAHSFWCYDPRVILNGIWLLPEKCMTTFTHTIMICLLRGVHMNSTASCALLK